MLPPNRFRRDTIATIVVNIGNDDASAFCGEQFRGCLANSGACAGYDGNLAIEFAHFFHLSVGTAF
jgi:hypothetical protein